MKLTLRARLLLLVSSVLIASGLVNWAVIQPRYEASVIDERLMILSQIQSQRLGVADDRLSSWIALMRAAGIQLSTNPQGMETVFRQYVRLFPDLQSMKITEPATGEFIEIRRSSADTSLIDPLRLKYHPVSADSSLRFAWSTAENQPQRILLFGQFSSGDNFFQLTAVFSDAFIRDQLIVFGPDELYRINLQLPEEVIFSDSLFEQLEPDFSALSRIKSERRNGHDYVGLTASLRSIPLSHSVFLDAEIIREPVKALFFRSSLILAATLVALFLGGWFLTAIIQRPLATFMEDTKNWSSFSFEKPIRVSGLPEFTSLTTALEEIRKKLAHYQKINVERIIVEQEKNMLLMQFASEMVALIDENDQFVFVNNRMAALFEEMQLSEPPKSFREFLKLSTVKTKERSFDERIQGEFRIKTGGMELRISTATHEYVFASEKVEIVDSQMKRLGAMVFLHDLTEDRKIDAMRTEMINLIIHELRNPVAGVVGLADLLMQQKLDTETQKQFFGLIRTNGQTMAQLINRFLDISRLESNKITVKKEVVSMLPLIKSAAPTFISQLQQKKIVLQLPQTEFESAVLGSPDLLSDAIRNLISNAIKYGPENRTIELDLQKDGNSSVFSITDHGFGIAPEHIDKVFQKFYRIKDSRINEIGTGLGLPYVKEIVEKHGGTLVLESKPEWGCRFSIRLPLAETKLADVV